MDRRTFEKFTQRTRKTYGARDDAVRYYVYQRTGIHVGKYSYGFEPLCLKKTTVSSIGSFCSIAINVGISLGNHPLNFISTSPALYLKKFNVIDNDIIDEKDYQSQSLLTTMCGLG